MFQNVKKKAGLVSVKIQHGVDLTQLRLGLRLNHSPAIAYRFTPKSCQCLPALARIRICG